MAEKSKINAVTELLLVLYDKDLLGISGQFFVDIIDENGVLKILLEIFPILIKFAK